MLRKYLARLLAFVLVLNLLLCAPLSAAAEEESETFDADPVTVETADNGGSSQTTVVVTESVPASTVGAGTSSQVTVKEQTVSVEIPADTALSQTPAEGSVPKAAEKPEETEATTGDTSGENTQSGTTIDLVTDNTTTKTETVVEYDAPVEGATQETVHVEESYDLKIEVTDAEKDAAGNLTDIAYDVSLDQKTTTTTDANEESTTTTVPNVDRKWNKDASDEHSDQPEIKVNLSANGMEAEEITRVEHKYTDENGAEQTEYYYNAKQVEEGSTKKTFTVSVVETVKETAEKISNTVVSLWTNFLGKFHITTDAFENQTTKEMSTTLDEAVNNAGSGETVSMLRDYTADKTAAITSSDNVTVDLGGKTYTSTDSYVATVTGDNKALAIQNGTMNGANRGILVKGSNNKLTIDNIELTAEGDVGVFDNGNNNTTIIKNSMVIAKTNDPYTIYHNGTYAGANIEIIGSYISATGENGWGIYISASKTSAADPVGLNNLTLTDSTIEGFETGVEVKYTNVTINNSKLVGFGTPAHYVADNNGSTTVGAALAVTDNRKYDENDPDKLVSKDSTAGTIIINGGYFYGHKDIDNIYVAAKLNADDPRATIHLNGGRFVNVKGLYNLTDDTHAVISHNDGSEYPYEVVKTGATPTRSGYTFQGYKDDKGNAITLEQAIATKAIAYAQWEKIVEKPAVEEKPAESATENVPTTPAAPAEEATLIIVEADSKGHSVDVAIRNTTAVVTVSNAAGDAAAVSKVTIPSVAELQKQGVETVTVQVEQDITLELGIAKTDETVADSIKITREEDKLVITDSNKSEIVIHVEELKAVATEPVSIKLDNGVLTINLGNGAYKLNVKAALATNKSLTVKLEDGVLKLYDSKGNLIEEVKL